MVSIRTESQVTAAQEAARIAEARRRLVAGGKRGTQAEVAAALGYRSVEGLRALRRRLTPFGYGAWTKTFK
jgi:hypothetical protein